MLFSLIMSEHCKGNNSNKFILLELNFCHKKLYETQAIKKNCHPVGVKKNRFCICEL